MTEPKYEQLRLFELELGKPYDWAGPTEGIDIEDFIKLYVEETEQ